MAEFGSSEAGKRGGQARAEKLTSEERKVIARQAAEARWEKEGKVPAPQATHEGVLKIGNAEIDCYVLDDKTRVISTRGVMKALGRRWRGRKYSGTELPVFLEAKNLKSFINEDLAAVLEVIKFRTSRGAMAEGFKAEILPLICETYLRARDAGDVLTAAQLPVAKQADILMRGLARVGIAALVDEATGHQRDTARDELAKILEAFVAKEIQKWLSTFELEFYELICDLRNEPLERAKKRPRYFGRLTNNLVYERLAPGVLSELRKLSPADERGVRKTKLFQGLTPHIGYPRLKEHLAGVTTAMKMAKIQGIGWEPFLGFLDQTHPKYKELPLFDGHDDESE